MEETDPYGYGATRLSPVGLAAAIVLGIALLVVPRRYAVWPMLIMACFVPSAQEIVVFGLNFQLLRVMVLFGTARILMTSGWKGVRWNVVDGVLLAFVFTKTMAYWAQRGGELSALKYALGLGYDAVGMYFLLRCLVKDWRDIWSVGVAAAVLSVPVAGFFLVEHATGRNMFSVFGGVPWVTDIRDGRLRCQGAFSHPILAGCFWASFLPLIVVLLKMGRTRLIGLVGLGCSLLIIVLCASSTPVGAVMFCVVGGLAFYVRAWLPLVRWVGFFGVVVMSFFKEKPIWHILGRLDFAGGSTGYHRYRLIEAAIEHFSEWCLVGVQSTFGWGQQLYDITNQYILEGVRGGVLTLFLFLVMIWLSFRNVGRTCRRLKKRRIKLMTTWALGVMLFAHCMIFFGVSYFGQIVFVWYLTLAMTSGIASMKVGRRRRLRRRVGPPAIRVYGPGGWGEERGEGPAPSSASPYGSY